MDKTKIGLFGGTFNPVHKGHIKAAERVQQKFCLDKVLFIPSNIPPHKKMEAVALPEHRSNMVKLAIADFPRFELCSVEMEAAGKSYSIYTLKKIKKTFPDNDVFFILGIDAFSEIDTWKDYEKVLQQCCFIVISRSGFRLLDAKEVIGGKYGGRICDVSGVQIGRDYKFLPGKIFLFPINALDVASTEIRKRIREGASWEGMVSERVEYYIKENKLYQKNE